MNQQKDVSINESKFDDWSGFSSGNLFQIMDYDDEDREADDIYNSVDQYAYFTFYLLGDIYRVFIYFVFRYLEGRRGA
jgi:pre-mRNA-processing factor 6